MESNHHHLDPYIVPVDGFSQTSQVFTMASCQEQQHLPFRDEFGRRCQGIPIHGTAKRRARMGAAVAKRGFNQRKMGGKATIEGNGKALEDVFCF